MLEKTLESPLDCKEIQPVHPKGDQSWVFTGRTDIEAETLILWPPHAILKLKLILWPPHAKNWLTGKDPDAGKDWRQEKGTTEDEMARRHHRLDGCELDQALGVGDGQGRLVCWSPWRRKESDMTERLNWTDLTLNYHLKGKFKNLNLKYYQLWFILNIVLRIISIMPWN